MLKTNLTILPITILLLLFSNKTKGSIIINPCDNCIMSFDSFKTMSKTELLDKYKNNDTAKAIINYFYNKRKKRLENFGIVSLGTIVGTGLAAIGYNKTSKTGKGLLPGIEFLGMGVLIFIGGLVWALVEALDAINHNKYFTYIELQYFLENKKLSKKLLRKKIFKT